MTLGGAMNQQELTIINLLAKEWAHSGPPGILDVSDINALVDLAPSEVLQALKVLYQSGLIDMNTLKTSAYLTPEGFSAAEEYRS